MHQPSMPITVLLATLLCLHVVPVSAAEEAAPQEPTFKAEEIEQLVAL